MLYSMWRSTISEYRRTFSIEWNSMDGSVRPLIIPKNWYWLVGKSKRAFPVQIGHSTQVDAQSERGSLRPLCFEAQKVGVASNPGDALTISGQVLSAVTATGRYAWKLEVIAGPLDQTVSRSTFVVAHDNSAFGAGWTFGPTDHLVTIAADPVNNLPAGMLRVCGTGG